MTVYFKKSTGYGTIQFQKGKSFTGTAKIY